MGKNWFMFVAMSLGTEFAVMSATPVPDGREAGHPCVVTTPSEKSATLKLIEEQDWARKVVEALRQNVDKYAERGEDYLSSRLYMNWKTQAKDVYIRGEWFSHVGEEKAPVPTVMFSGARAAATAYARPGIEERLPYADETQGVYMKNRNLSAFGMGKARESRHADRKRQHRHHASCTRCGLPVVADGRREVWPDGGKSA